MSRRMHMICLRSPWPDNTGGARDMLDRLKVLHEAGIHIQLHFFTEGNTEKALEALKPYCEQVWAYPKKLTLKNIWKGHPYIIACRSSDEILGRLVADDDPILFDGIHTTAGVHALASSGRKMAVRMHNDEVRYYRELARSTRNPLKRFYFLWEAIRLNRWMKKLPRGLSLGCIQEQERITLQTTYPHLETFLLPPVIPSTVFSQTGTGGYCLYHGDLSVPANERAAIWLLKRVFAKLKLPLVIAGKSPSAKLEKLVHFYQHACLVANPTRSELIDLIGKAQINVLPSRTQSGIKLKIFDALQYGRHCVINSEMGASSPWTDSCIVVTDDGQMAEAIQTHYIKPFTQRMIEIRQERLQYWKAQLEPVGELIRRLW